MASPALGDWVEEAPSPVARQMQADAPRSVALSVPHSLAPLMGAAETSLASPQVFLSEEWQAA